MTKWTLNEIAEATDGVIYHTENHLINIADISFDSRNLSEGSLFVPLIAERNGHEYIDSAIGNGASAAFWSEPVEKAPKDFPIIQVKDTLQALQQFAKWYLKKVNPKVVGITGSNGKTTTKDMTEAVLSAKYKTHKTVGNFNNHIGLPYTILGMPRETEAIILEMGMSQADEIHVLSTLAEPDVAVITMIGESHIEFFGSRDGIADAKMEIVDGLKSDGVLIYPGEEPLLAERTAILPEERVRTFGRTDKENLYATKIEVKSRSTEFSVNLAPELKITLPTPGEYNVQNALAAILVGIEFGISIKASAEKLEQFQLTKNRLEWIEGFNGSQLLNDAYNASPSSMKAVLNYFATIETNGKKIVVLGDILELGELSEELHRDVAASIDAASIDYLILYGEKMRTVYNEVKGSFNLEKIRHFSGDKKPMVDYLRKTIQSEDIVLLKSSLGTNILEVVEKLKKKTLM
ncbi:UDP-N-acetylmuramoyl-tripeptide--D-alanyl-D-alanine ligase [Marinilactibacillus sp. 15R]|uniref:UDP-N-acetylmuramoyl-tripeptide--D-alanyl-D- alanine ligase n=1 Tax=Marinilactibacillus sp. 15R TaxID=1911586 RepID=UPI00090B7C48|nr:UDP-N-acetylmuramoyl-tripeptide--D-alanyl-D-alanine ligase [Marinilactibacillus sp. 15R]API88639.1 UDP-N-acetylmuramoyl-tripeptide--D-alanyl-D-alanine ligase [Marinilactibacillus sp. 15R]